MNMERVCSAMFVVIEKAVVCFWETELTSWNAANIAGLIAK